MGERKVGEFGPALLAEIRSHLANHPRQIFAHNSFQGVPGVKTPARPADQAAADSDGPLFEKLRQVRLEVSRARGVPAYVILHDSTLRELARTQPTTEAEFAAVPRIGEKRARQFGKPFLEVIAAARGQSA
jgi:superfamily II DNA helicase RecQ